MNNVYDNEKECLKIDICFRYEYLEVFGLDPEDFEELEEWYRKKIDNLRDKNGCEKLDSEVHE